MKTKINFKIVSIFIILSLNCLSCATIMHGTRQDVLINSLPTGADIYVNNQFCGQTPQTVSMKRKYRQHIYLFKEGYEPYYCSLKPKYGATTTGNCGYIGAGTAVGVCVSLAAWGSEPFGIILLGATGGLLGIACAAGGFACDLISGAAYSLPASVNAHLQQADCLSFNYLDSAKKVNEVLYRS